MSTVPYKKTMYKLNENLQRRFNAGQTRTWQHHVAKEEMLDAWMETILKKYLYQLTPQSEMSKVSAHIAT